MKTLTFTFLLLTLTSCIAIGQVVAGTDVIVGTGVNMDFINHNPSSMSTLSVKITSIGSLPTYATGTFETTFAQIRKGNVSSGVVSPHAGITQVLYSRKYVYLWAHTQSGVVKLDYATLGQLEGGVGVSWDIGAQFTGGKYHILVTPYLREVSITSLQVKPVVGALIQTGFKKGN